MSSTRLILAILLLALSTAQEFPGCHGSTNNSPLIDQPPKLISEVYRGSLYKIENATNILYIANVTGTPYQMGQAHGTLLKEQIHQNYQEMNEYIRSKFKDALSGMGLPGIFSNVLSYSVMLVWDFLLMLNYLVSSSYIPERYVQEMKGISDATQIDLDAVIQVNMIPELIKASCTIVGAYGVATVNTDMYSLRALDWEPDAPVNRNPSMIVYHSTEEGSHPFANIGFAGFIGGLTVIGSQGVSISEKVWIPRNDIDMVPTTYFGKPWAFVTRDLGEFGTSMESMVSELYSTHRTCRIHIGMASEESKDFEIANYSWKVLQIFNDKNFTDSISYGDNHPVIDDVVYVDKYIQPSHNPCLGNLLKHYEGQIDAEVLFRQVAGTSQTGDFQVCVADVYHNVIYLSYSEYHTEIRAYDRSPMYIDLNPFFGTNKLNKAKEIKQADI